MSTDRPPGLEICVLGPIEARRDGEDVPLGGRRQRALLALLAMEPGRPVPADRLIDELWAGEPPDGADITLRTYVSRLRAALGEDVPIIGTAAGYALELRPERIDATRFQALVHDADALLAGRNPRRASERFREALAMWRGSPYGELGADGALRDEAARLEEVRLRALEARVEADLALGVAGELVDELEGLVRVHPYREAFWRQLMLALYRSERQADALAAFHRATTALDEQLGLEPGEELQALQAAILRHEVPEAIPPEARHNLPAPLTSFIGRDAELAEVGRLLETARLVTLTGVGGVGKTRLAVEAARARIAELADGVAFVDLAPLTDPALVPAALGSVLDVREDPAQPLLERLAAHLRTQELLIVLDNCEHLREAAANVAHQLLSAAPGLRILATSRETLGIPGEAASPVAPLRLPADGDPAAARTSEAVRLFLERVRDVRAGVGDDDATIEVVRRICAELDGLPLAIELAAARARALSLTDIAGRLRDRFQFLVSWRTLAPSRHRTLRETLDWSFDLLGAEEQRLLADLAVFPGGFTLEAVAAVSFGGDESRALDVLERLVDASLVIVESAVERTRYRMLETVRQYAGERLGERRESAEAALAAWVEGLLRSVIPDGSSPIPPAAYDRIDEELDSIRAALRHAAADPDPDQELSIAATVWRYWWIRTFLAEATPLYLGIVERRGILPTTLGIRTARAAASFLWTTGEHDRAEELGLRVLATAAQAGDVFEQASTLNLLGAVARSRKRLEDAGERFSRAAELAKEMGNAELTNMYLGNVATVFMDVGRLDEARELLLQNLEYRRSEGKSDGVGLAHLNLGQVELDAGNMPAAEMHFAEAADAFRSMRFKGRAANALQGLAAVEARTGRAEAAARRLGAAAALIGGSGWATGDSYLEGQATDAARAALGDEAFGRLFDEGLEAERRGG